MHARDFAQAHNDLLQVFEVGDVEHDLDTGLAIRGMSGDVADVALGVADDASDAFQHAETVVAEHCKFYGIGGGRGFVAGPFHIDAALWFVEQVCDVRTIDRMHGHAFAPRDVADNTFATNGIATSGPVDEHVALAFDRDGVVIAEDAANDAGNPTRFRAVPSLADSALTSGATLGGGRGTRPQPSRQNLAPGIFAVADSGHEVVGIAEPVARGNFLNVFVFDLFERDAVLARFLLDQLAANLNGPLTLVDVQPVLDLVTRPRGLDQRKPITAGVVAVMGMYILDISGVNVMPQGHHTAIDLGADAGVADLGVNGVSKIDRRGVARQHYNFPLGRKGVNLFGIEVDVSS